jgi:hypothetical protein
MAQESLNQKRKNIQETKTHGKKAKATPTYKVRLEKDDVREYAKHLIKNNKKVFDRLADL